MIYWEAIKRSTLSSQIAFIFDVWKKGNKNQLHEKAVIFCLSYEAILRLFPQANYLIAENYLKI